MKFRTEIQNTKIDEIIANLKIFEAIKKQPLLVNAWKKSKIHFKFSK